MVRMAKGFLKQRGLTRDILLRLADVGLFTIAATSPYFLYRLAQKYFAKVTDDAAKKIARRLREMERKKLVEIKELPNGEARVVIAHRGKTLVRQYRLEEMKLKKPARWDRKWRLVIYDIPDYHRRASDAFRERLRSMGLFRLQKSVWISPYECLEEIEFLCAVFEIDIDACVCYLRLEAIPREKEIKEFFRL